MRIRIFYLTLLVVVLVVAGLAGSQFAATLIAQESDKQEAEEQDEQEQEEGDDEPETVMDMLQAAQSKARENKLGEAIDILEKALKKEPGNLNTQVFLLQALQQHGLSSAESGERSDANPHFFRAAELARDMLANEETMEALGERAKPFLAQVIYNEACCYSIEGKLDKAMASLEEAFELGFNDFELAKTDSDLEALRERDGFSALIKKQMKLAAERLAKETATELEEFESFEFDFELTDVNGETVSLDDFSGQLLIVDFWGTWCPPCREEIPSFIKLKKKYGDQGLEIVGITYERTDDEEEALEQVTTYMEENNMNYNCVMGDDETQEQVNLRGYPTTLFIDEQGKVRLKLVGLHSYQKLESVVKLLLEEQQQQQGG